VATDLSPSPRALDDPAHQAFSCLRSLFTVAPRFGGWLVAGWLAGIVVNLLSIPGFYDVAQRDVGLLVAAVALARLSVRYDQRAGAAA
jgi:hypothetical protein